MLCLVVDPIQPTQHVHPAPLQLRYHVETDSGLRLASFPTRTMAESYARSALVKLALDLQQEFGQNDNEEGTLA